MLRLIANLTIFRCKVKKLEQPSDQNQSQPRKAMFLPQTILKTTIQKLQILCSLILFYMSLVCHSYVIHMYAYVTRMSFV